MDALEKWMIIWFTPYQTTTLPKCSPKNFCSNHPCCLMFSAAFKYVAQITETTFAFLFCHYPSSMVTIYYITDNFNILNINFHKCCSYISKI